MINEESKYEELMNKSDECCLKAIDYAKKGDWNMELVKVTVRTANGLIVKCELTSKTIKELKTENQVSVRKSGGKNNV